MKRPAGVVEGRTQFHAPEIDGKVYINDCGDLETLEPGRFYKAEITEAHDYDVVALAQDRCKRSVIDLQVCSVPFAQLNERERNPRGHFWLKSRIGCRLRRLICGPL